MRADTEYLYCDGCGKIHRDDPDFLMCDCGRVSIRMEWATAEQLAGLVPLPSRRYTCRICGGKNRGGNKTAQRLLDPVCPACLKTANREVKL